MNIYSMAALMTSQNMTRKSKLTLEYHNTLPNLIKHQAVKLLWTPEYNISRGNKIADNFAWLEVRQALRTTKQMWQYPID